MPRVRMAVHHRIRTGFDGLVHFVGNEHSAERQVTTGQPFRERDEIRRDAFVFAGVSPSRATHAAHDFVEDQQHPVLIADLPDASEISWNGRHATERRPDHRLRNERRHRIAPELEDLRFELVRNPPAVRGLGLVLALPPICEARRDMMHRAEQQRFENGAAPDVAAGGKCACRRAVIALQSPDHVPPLRLTCLDKILARDFQRRFDRFRAAARPLAPESITSSMRTTR